MLKLIDEGDIFKLNDDICLYIGYFDDYFPSYGISLIFNYTKHEFQNKDACLPDHAFDVIGHIEVRDAEVFAMRALLKRGEDVIRKS